MAYVNEEISEADYIKYSYLPEMRYSATRSKTNSDYWIINREKGMWLKEYVEGYGRDDSDGIWCLYYNGYLVFIKTEETHRDFNQKETKLYICIKFIRMYSPLKRRFRPQNPPQPQLPEELEDKKEEILKEFKKALELSFGHPRDGFRYQDKGVICKIDLECNGKII